MTAVPLDSSQPPQIRMIDLFAGPGGLDVAAAWLGIEATGIEWDSNACTTRKAAELDTVQGDVRDFDAEKFPQHTVLAGGPPCQTYTVAGSGAGRKALDQVLDFVKRMGEAEDDAARKQIEDDLAVLDDGDEHKRTTLVLQPLKWALAAHRAGHPYDAIVLEQVPAVLRVWEAMAEVFEHKLGYSVAVGTLHTEEFGVPQTRRRAILIARRNGKATLPSPTHHRYRKGTPRGVGAPDLKQWVSMGDALDRKSDFVVISNYGTGGDPKLRGRRHSNEPSATVTGKISRNVLEVSDPSEGTRFRPCEAGRLQTFPHDYPWDGGDISQQIGNAIPPRLAAHVLAAALGIPLDAKALDEAVRSDWLTAKATRPLAHRPSA